MQLINSFDILSDFYSDAQLRTIFHEEYDSKVPSQHMWALLLYAHPESKYYSQEPSTRLSLIRKDYLNDSSFTIEPYSSTIEKIENFLLTKPQRLLASWEQKLEERDLFIKSLPYDASTFEMLDKMMASSYKMWQNYKDIYDLFLKEKESKIHGSVVESLSEQAIL